MDTTPTPPPITPNVRHPEIATEKLFEQRGGIQSNNLNNYIDHYLQNEDQETFPTSLYYDIDSIIAEIYPYKEEFIHVSLNIECVAAKID